MVRFIAYYGIHIPAKEFVFGLRLSSIYLSLSLSSNHVLQPVHTAHL